MENEGLNNINIDRVASFKKAFDGMTATNESSYNERSYVRTRSITNYDAETVQVTIENGSSEELKKLSEFYFYSSGFYRRINAYYATLLKYTHVIIPHILDENKSLTDKKLSKKYYDTVNFMDNFPFVDACTNFALKALVDGAYYGIIKDFGDSIVIHDLPFEYCRSRFKNAQNVDIIEMDMKYFDQIRDEGLRKASLKSFPKEIQKGYQMYQANSQLRWVFVPDEMGIYFKIFEEKPFFLNTIPAILEFKDYKEIEKNKDSQEIKKILVQKMPSTNNGELVFEPEEAEEMHRGSVNMMKKNPDISVLTTYADVSLESMVDARQAISNNLEKIEKTIYSEAGVSKQLFAADGNLSMDKSLQNDLSLMMVLADKISSFFSYVLSNKFGDNKISFKLKILPISFYNTREYSENAYKLATTGYSFIIPALTVGISQTDMMDLKKLENDLLKLEQILKPLQSTYTQSGKENAGGAPKKEDDQKSDKTIKNQTSMNKGGKE